MPMIMMITVTMNVDEMLNTTYLLNNDHEKC